MIFFFYIENGIFCVLIRIASMRLFSIAGYVFEHMLVNKRDTNCVCIKAYVCSFDSRFDSWIVACFLFNGTLSQHLGLYHAVSQKEVDRSEIEETRHSPHPYLLPALLKPVYT